MDFAMHSTPKLGISNDQNEAYASMDVPGKIYDSISFASDSNRPLISTII